MSEQERIDYLAGRIRNFNIVISGGGELNGGFGVIPDKGVTIDHLESSFANFMLVGNRGILAAGSIEKGYTIFGG